MSEEAKKEGGAEAAPPAAPAKKGSKLPMIVAALMVAEAATVYMVVGMINKKPPAAEAKSLEHGEEKKEEEFVEIPVIEDHFQNMQTGRVWVWDASITVRVKKKFEKKVTEKLQARVAEIHEGVATIFRRATAAQLKEPGLETVNRQLFAYFEEIFGKEKMADKEPESLIEKVLIPRCRGFPAE